MSKSRTRKKTTPVRRNVRKGGDLQRLHIKVNSPRIVMHQVVSGLVKGVKCFICLLLLSLVCYGSYRGIEHLFIGNEKYRLRYIDVVDENGDIYQGTLQANRIVELALDEEGNQLIDLGKTIFLVDVDKVGEVLSALPEIEKCEVERRLPGTIKITVKERIPIAWIKSDSLGFPGRANNGVLIDEYGVTFPYLETQFEDVSEAVRKLPVIIMNKAQSENFQHGFKTGVRAIFGMHDHQRQINDFIRIREYCLKKNLKIKKMNLIPKINIPVEFEAPNSTPKNEPVPIKSGEPGSQDVMIALDLIKLLHEAGVRAEWLPAEIELTNDYSMTVICNDADAR